MMTSGVLVHAGSLASLETQREELAVEGEEVLCWCGTRWRCCWGVQVRSRSVTEVRTGCSGKPGMEESWEPQEGGALRDRTVRTKREQ